MKRHPGWPIALGAAVVGLTTLAAPAPGAPPETAREVRAVASVDLDRYAGRWFEIARLPNRYQESCGCCVTATYTRRPDGRLTVANACRTSDGEARGVEGEAKLADDDGPTSKLKVRFAPGFLSFFGFVWGDYWVLDLAEDYSHALVGSPDRKSLWVLARTPTLPEETYTALLDKALEMGFDVERVQKTPQED